MITINISLFFTFFRLIFSPFLLAPLIVWNDFPVVVSFIYWALAATDFLDGFFARKFKQVTIFGAFLDQFSDKIFIFSVMFATVYIHQCHWSWAVALSVRELLVMGLREQKISLPVSFSAKMKTAFQILFFGWLLYHNSSGDYTNFVSLTLLTITVLLSYYSAFFYIKKVMHAYKTLL